MKKDNNLILSSLRYLSNEISHECNNSNINEKQALNIILLNTKILLTITYHKDLTDLFLENKVFFNLIINIFSKIISSNNCSIEDNLSKIYNIFLQIVNHIINNGHKLFISQIISNKFTLGHKR